MSEYRYYFYVTFSSKEPISSRELCSFMASDKLQELSEKDKLKMAMFAIIREGLPIKTDSIIGKYCVFFGELHSEYFRDPLKNFKKVECGWYSGTPEIYTKDCFLGSKSFCCSFEKKENGSWYNARYKGFGIFKRNLEEEHRLIFPLLFLMYLAMGNKENNLFSLKLTAISNLAGRWLLKRGLYNRKKMTDDILDKLFEECFARIDPNYEGKALDYEDSYKFSEFEYIIANLRPYSDKSHSLADLEHNPYVYIWGNDSCKGSISECLCHNQKTILFNTPIECFKYAVKNSAHLLNEHSVVPGLVEEIRQVDCYQYAKVLLAIDGGSCYCLCYVLDQFGTGIKMGDFVECGVLSKLSKKYSYGAVRARLELVYCLEHQKWLYQKNEEYKLSVINEEVVIDFCKYFVKPSNNRIKFPCKELEKIAQALHILGEKEERKINELTMKRQDGITLLKNRDAQLFLPDRLKSYLVYYLGQLK